MRRGKKTDCRFLFAAAARTDDPSGGRPPRRESRGGRRSSAGAAPYPGQPPPIADEAALCRRARPQSAAIPAGCSRPPRPRPSPSAAGAPGGTAPFRRQAAPGARAPECPRCSFPPSPDTVRRKNLPSGRRHLPCDAPPARTHPPLVSPCRYPCRDKSASNPCRQSRSRASAPVGATARFCRSRSGLSAPSTFPSCYCHLTASAGIAGRCPFCSAQRPAAYRADSPG